MVEARATARGPDTGVDYRTKSVLFIPSCGPVRERRSRRPRVLPSRRGPLLPAGLAKTRREPGSSCPYNNPARPLQEKEPER